MSEKLKKAPKTKIIKVLRAIKRSAKSHPDIDKGVPLAFIAEYGISNYADYIDEYNTSKTTKEREALVEKSLEALGKKTKIDYVQEVFDSIPELLEFPELLAPITNILGITCQTHLKDDLVVLYTSRENAGGGEVRIVLDNYALVDTIDSKWPGLCVNKYNMTVMRLDPDTNELRPLTTNEANYPDLVLAMDDNVGAKRQDAISAINYLASQSEFDPAREMILSCVNKHSDVFTTSETSDELLESLAFRLFGTESKLVAKGFAQALICMVKYVFEPDAKPLMYAPCLIGAGGLGKSALLAALIPKEWRHYLHKVITVSPTKFYSDLTQISVGWLQELAEFDRFIRGGLAEDFKAVLTTEVNNFRAPYARTSEDHTRFASFFGTSNKEDGILTDGTSAHDRRILPIKINPDSPIPWNLVEDGMNAEIWAAAYNSYKHSEVYSGYLSEMPSEWYGDLMELQKDFRADDSFAVRLSYEMSIQNTVSVSDILEDAFEIAPGQQTKEHISRINSLLKTLYSKEWTEKRIPVRKGASADRVRVWVRKVPLTGMQFTSNLLSYKEAGYTPIKRTYYRQPDPFQSPIKVEETTDFE